eukprot:CAMPEP_0175994802 /NCGR_PEP_ID=MMETSP0108-20121206/54788_1 /TAXON_ID=195067 ORGANISM="Goniomonas pacifica, Strain CCMP1869" /NCGR_SAMPLE_ID=MMETSP0108 /ASSEMBLY_ACC=CAM_ASM_000204 /LENGTH=114 /DNA_ID=CAMNT_0017326873 /DNA_START=103 /DNA_END=444 /DNA_ORIENTATION=-
MCMWPRVLMLGVLLTRRGREGDTADNGEGGFDTPARTNSSQTSSRLAWLLCSRGSQDVGFKSIFSGPKTGTSVGSGPGTCVAAAALAVFGDSEVGEVLRVLVAGRECDDVSLVW